MPLFAFALFLSSTLLFLVQPMFAKRMLPLLGGTPAVWNTCMLFYQTLLLAGYGYSHFVTSRFPIRKQAAIHAVLLLLPFISLIVGIPNWSPPGDSNPIPWLLAMLALSVGLPFFAVSTSAPLLQKWFSGTTHAAARDPYFLYAASNLGSMVALLAYPLILEPSLALDTQSRSWAVGYALFVGTMFTCIFRIRNAAPAVPTGEKAPDEPLPLWPRRLKWIALAFVPSSLMLGLTTYATSNIAPFPLLWVIPLALYLLTFIFVFARRQIVSHRVMVALQPVFLILLAVVFFWEAKEFDYQLMFPFHVIAFFFTAMVCHGELAATRPGTRHLTEFYLWMSVGGALGGLFNSLLAPLLFTTLLEYPLVIVAACLVRPWTASKNRASLALDLSLPVWLWFVMEVACALVIRPERWGDHEYLRPMAVFVPAGALCLFLMGRPVRLALGIAMILFVSSDFTRLQNAKLGYAKPSRLVRERNFYGTLCVKTYDDGTRFLIHGNILHGAQNDRFREEPLTYYHRGGPIGQVFEAYASKLEGANISVVGLGAGTMAAYGRPGQHWTFYEINPIVERIARNPDYFTFLADCKAKVDVVLGDGRLTMKKAPANHYAIMAFDAFTSDAIPVHLITREAIQLYLEKLAPGGVLAFHISARFVDLKPVLRELARDAKLACRLEQEDPRGLTERDKAINKNDSTWVVMARTEKDLEPLDAYPFVAPEPLPKAKLWTDDFSNIFEALRFPKDY